MTLIDDEAAAHAADALQAAYFRTSLVAEQAELLAAIAKRRADLELRAERGRTHAVDRLRSQLRKAEADVRNLERLISQLDRRFF